MDQQNTPYPPDSSATPSGMPAPEKSDTTTEVPPPYSPPQGGAAYPPTQYGFQSGVAYPPAQGGMGVAYQTGPPPNDAIIRSTQHQTTTQVVMVGSGTTCPRCRTGVLQEDFTLLGICCAIFFFPLGLICCMMMRQRRCTYCGSVYM